MQRIKYITDAFRRVGLTLGLFIIVGALSPSTEASALDPFSKFLKPKGQTHFHTRLNGFEEVSTSQVGNDAMVASIFTDGQGKFHATLWKHGRELKYKLQYSNLSGEVTQAHIHFSQSRTTGGVMVFLCQTEGFQDPTGLAPECVQEGMVEGTLTMENLIPLPDQTFDGSFEDFLRILKSNAGYVNVHTTQWPPGELRGQVSPTLFVGKPRP